MQSHNNPLLVSLGLQLLRLVPDYQYGEGNISLGLELLCLVPDYQYGESSMSLAILSSV